MPNRLDKIHLAVNRFIRKAKRRNLALEAFRETDVFLEFEQALYDGILAQADWAAEHLAEAPAFPEEPNDIRITLWKSAMQTWMTDMPSTAKALDFDSVYQLFYDAFTACVKARMKDAGMITKGLLGTRMSLAKADESIDEFVLTNVDYINALKDQASYLLNTKSKSYDQTTKDRLVNMVRDARLDRQTIDEVADLIHKEFPNISSVRSFMISTTETANAFGQASQAFRVENGIDTKVWIIAGPHNLVDECDDNADDGEIPTDEAFSSGDMAEPAHIGCECYTDSGKIDLDSIDIWTGE